MFGFVFAINSSIHSFLILNYTNKNRVTLDVGFYYMSNAFGRLIGNYYLDLPSNMEVSQCAFSSLQFYYY